MKQGDAVFQAVVNVCGKRDGKYDLSKEEKASVRAILFEGFKSGSIELDKDWDDKKISEYIPGLINNWLRKDKRLNGGVKYEAKNPGSRAGSGDARIQAMRMLLKTKTDPSEKAEIQCFIDKRLAELKPATVEVNIDDLPAELRAKYIK